MGFAMKKLRGKIPGSEVLNFIQSKENSLIKNAESEKA